MSSSSWSRRGARHAQSISRKGLQPATRSKQEQMSKVIDDGYVALPSRINASDNKKRLLSTKEQEKIFYDMMDKLVSMGVYRGNATDDPLVPYYYCINETTDPTVLSKQASKMAMTFRQLRETITATRRIDAFAVQVYERSAETALLAQDTPELIVALTRLIEELYPALSTLDAIIRPPKIIQQKHNNNTDNSNTNNKNNKITSDQWYQFAERITRAYQRRQQTSSDISGSRIINKESPPLIMPSWRKNLLQVLRISHLQLPAERLIEWLCFDSISKASLDYLQSQQITLNEAGTIAYLRPPRR
ncbi:hypothetical protein BDF19DRAFT_428430 [Syncephalis fuscata]|nr:hypothetical protein BDF19DRAFT_428430 [Syncephalis fuscata]